MVNDFWAHIYWGNTMQAWATAAAILVACFLLMLFFNKKVIQLLKKLAAKTESNLDDLIVAHIEKLVTPVFVLSAFYFSFNVLTVPPKVDKWAHIIFMVIVTYFILRICTLFVKNFVFSFIKSSENSEAKEKQISGLMIIVNIAIWGIGILFLLNNLGYNVSTLVAGLGIGGIAIALAAQTILGDLFSYFVIFFDKPFEIGDFIIFEDKMGAVEHIGIKTTRLRSLSGEQLVCSNTYLTNARLHNYKRMERRRVVFSLGVIYDTPTSKMKLIPGMVKSIVEAQENITFDRGNFSEFGNFSLNFEFVYYVESADFNQYRNIHENICLNIKEQFEEQGIEFAFPTQTLYMNQAEREKNV